MMIPGIRRLAPAALLVALSALAACDDNPMEPELIAPAGLAVEATSPTTARISFQAVPDAEAYVVQRAEGAGSFGTVGTATTTRYEDTGLAPQTQYRYRVAASRGETTSDFSAEFAITTPQAGPRRAVISQDITTSRTLFSDTTYVLRGFVKVANGATLTIQPGTRIEGDYEVVGSSLFILRGARIMAEGTAERPIVFTSSRPEGQRQPGDWGGLVIVGNGIINRGRPVILEGTGTGASNPQVDYSGGTNNADSSGSLKYVRIEFAGYATAPDAELNALTLAAVGSGTTIDYVQALAGLDDSFEFFGGAVDAKHMVSYEAGDDHFDMSEGYQGRLQYLIAYQTKVLTPRTGAGNVSSDPQGIENDGCAGSNCLSGQASQPYNLPLVANFTLVGPGTGSGAEGSSGGIGMMLRRGTGGYYVNGVVARWPRAALSLRDATTQTRATAGDLVLNNLLLADNGTAFQAQTGSTVQFSVDAAANSIQTASVQAASLFSSLPADPTSAAQLDWSLTGTSPARTGGATAFSGAVAARAGTFVTATGYRGAADPSGAKWWQGWTAYADN